MPKDDDAQDKEWLEMWEDTNSCLAEFEGMSSELPKGECTI
jgi:hypothetical protein